MTQVAASRIAGKMEDLAAFAEELARAARNESLHRFADGCAIENKAVDGFDPVTAADRAAEQAMRQLIAERFPAHGIRGEELGDVGDNDRLSWSLDPIDGTRAFICGLPTWTTLIALLEEGRPVLGLVDAPALDETYIGYGTSASLLRNGTRSRIRASDCARLSDARLSTTDPFLFDEAGRSIFERLRKQVLTVRYGLDGYGYAKLAAGGLDLVVESGLKPHDYNAVIGLVLAAGGVVGDWLGGQDYAGGRVIAASTAELFGEVLGYIEEWGSRGPT